MPVARKHAGHQTRYEFDRDNELSAVLTYTADPGDPATWKILLPGPSGTEDQAPPSAADWRPAS